VQQGDVVVRREVWRDLPWSALAAVVIEDSSDLLALHVPVGAPFGFAASHPLGTHAWSRSGAWQGSDVVMLQRPGEAYSVWHFGPSWTYVNLQDPFRRTAIGIDTFDHELDIVIGPDGTWLFKDEDHLAASLASGRFRAEEIDAIRREGARVGAMIDAATTWWGTAWSSWTPPPSWPSPTLSADWITV
jgi:Protein of unknown function (DUF402)